MPEPGQSLDFLRGPKARNRLILAPLTNTQSNEDGTLTDDEWRWLVMRAEGGFGITMTCAAHVQPVGKGFPGQLGVFSDSHLDGLRRLADGIHQHGSLAIAQLHHAGIRSPAELIGCAPVGPSDHAKTGARGLSGDEVYALIDDFVAAAVRCDRAGFDGVEIHGAHGYIICQFLSPEINRRRDEFGGSPENRARLLDAVVEGVRNECGPDFSLGVRLSPERFGLRMGEMLELAQRLLRDEVIDFLDMSLWDVFKEPEDQHFKGKSLLRWFAGLQRARVQLCVAGNIRSGSDVHKALAGGVDAVVIGRAAILHHDFPNRVIADPAFVPVDTPVSEDYLLSEGVSKAFIDYLRPRFGMVSDT